MLDVTDTQSIADAAGQVETLDMLVNNGWDLGGPEPGN